VGGSGGGQDADRLAPHTPDAAALWQDLDELVYYQDFPFCSSSIYAQYRVMKAAAEGGVKVLLDGQGGDELFTGYGTYYPTT